MIALNELQANVPYWGFATVIAAGFYGTIRWFGVHFNENFKRELTHWLNGAYVSSWSVHFCRLFDQVFGDKPISLKRLVRSSIASFVAVGLLYILFAQVLGVLGNRTYGNFGLLQALLIGVMINLVPDYISLLETRWLLERFAKVNSFFTQVLLLIADLLFSAAIVWIAIALFSLVRDGRAPSPVELIALFNVYAVFFYSTFLTSLWAWVYCLSAWFIKLFSKLGLGKVLDVDGAPVRQLALVGSLLLFTGALLGSSLLKSTDNHGSSRFNDFVCRIDLNSCLHAARLSNDLLRVVHYMSTVCGNNFYTKICDDHLIKFFSDDSIGIDSLLRKACDGGEMTGCTYLAYSYTKGHGFDVDFEQANTLFRQACDGGDMNGCNSLGLSYENGTGFDVDFEQANALYRQACDGGYMNGCTNLGLSYADGHGFDVDFEQANTLFRQACDGGDTNGCNSLGVSYENGTGLDVDFEQANALYRQACDGGDMNGCNSLGVSYENGTGFDVDFKQANALYRQACDGGDMNGCNYLGLSYADGHGFDVDFEQALFHSRS